MAPSVRQLDIVGVDAYEEGHESLSHIRNATTITELTSTLPQTFRPALGQVLNKAYRAAVKMANVQNTIAQYERHVSEGTQPSSIAGSLKVPKIQYSKEFLGTTTGRNAPDSLLEKVKEARKEVLKAALSNKTAEFQSLQDAVRWDNSEWRTPVLEVANRLGAALSINFTWDEAAPDNVSIHGDDTTELAQEVRLLWKHGSRWHYQAIAIARSHADRSLLEKTKNLSLKKETDVAMRDADSELTTREVVRDEMKAVKDEILKALKSKSGQKQGQSLGKRRDHPLISDSPLRKKARQERRLELFSHQEEASEKGPEEGKEMTTSAFLSQCSKEFRPWLPDTFPLVYGSLSLSCRMRINAALMRTWELETVRTARPGVFQQEGVSLPEDIEYMLSVNHKFILHQDPSQHDVNDAIEKFRRTVRNRWFFRQSEKKEFIPKFHVASPFWNPPRASRAIERGIDAAVRVIESQVSRALADIATRPRIPTLTRWRQVRQFLEDNDLLVKLTDKNLGLAVFTVQWYDTRALELLADTVSYQPVTSIPVQEISEKLRKRLAKWCLPEKMEKFIEKRTLEVVPEFHGIPKVHKTPWKLRPIVPSHSWVTSCVSQVLDHLLRPVLSKLPWVVSSSKEVINLIKNWKPQPGKEIWLVTGDVEAFYTNIPPRECAKIVSGAWQRYQPHSSIDEHTIWSMVMFIMENNYFRYRGQAFKQCKGLAMGTAAAPILANIYAAFYERRSEMYPRWKIGQVLYCRYIDDIFAILQGSRDEVENLLQRHQLGGLNVTWKTHSLRMEFLDIEVLVQASIVGPEIHTRLFRKEMNKFLYIPWSSAHPSSVKKGFVKAELTRFAILCSRPEYFADARQEFYGNLRRRGYPAQTLGQWFLQVHYGDRAQLLLPADNAEDQQAPLMLPGHYNPVWDYVDVNEVLAAAKRNWNQDELPDSLQVPLIRSLGRTTSLFDMLSTWNKTILLSSSDAGPLEDSWGGG